VDMVVVFSKCVVDAHRAYETNERKALLQDLSDIKERFLKLWRDKNKDRGLELSIKTFDNLILRYSHK